MNERHTHGLFNIRYLVADILSKTPLIFFWTTFILLNAIFLYNMGGPEYKENNIGYQFIRH